MTKKLLQDIEVRLEATSHELIVKIGDRYYTQTFGQRLTAVGVARKLHDLAQQIENVDTLATTADALTAVSFVRRTGRATISLIQREFSWGYNRAARALEELEALRVVSPAKQDGSRDILPYEGAEERVGNTPGCPEAWLRRPK